MLLSNADQFEEHVVQLEAAFPGVPSIGCIDFCTGNDACVLTTVSSVLGSKRIPLVGGTGDAGKVSVNGKVYTDADVYVFVKNNGGKVGVYKENIYRPMEEGYRMIASKTDRRNYTMGEPQYQQCGRRHGKT